MNTTRKYEFRTEMIHSSSAEDNVIWHEVLSTPVQGIEPHTNVDQYFLHLGSLEILDFINETFDYIESLNAVNISININANMLHDDEIMSLIHKKALHLIESKKITFAVEIHERCAKLISAPHILKKLQKLKDSEIQVWLDNFGSGAANFYSILNEVFDVIKIDKATFWPIYQESESLMIEIINYISKVKNKNVVVQGVETESQLSFVYEQGCLAQGYILK